MSATDYATEQALRAAQREVRDRVGLLPPDEWRRLQSRRARQTARRQDRWRFVAAIVGLVLIAVLVALALYALVYVMAAVLAFAVLGGFTRSGVWLIRLL